MMRKWIEIITEFEKSAVSGGGLPPAVDMERRGGGDNAGGRYWLGPTGKVAIARGQYGADEIDFAQMVFAHPEKFGLTLDEVKRFVDESDLSPSTKEMVHRGIASWYSDESFGRYPGGGPVSFSGGRSLGIRILMSRGWLLVQYNPPQSIGIMGSATGIRKDIDLAVEHFPMMQCDAISIKTVDTSTTDIEYNGTSAEFYKEDYPGFGGHVTAMLDWVSGDHTPRYHFVYVRKDAEVKFGFLHLDRVTRKGYFLPYLDENRGRNIRDRQNYIRFSSQLTLGLKGDYSTVYGTILHSNKPFEIPKDVQTWNGRNWS